MTIALAATGVLALALLFVVAPGVFLRLGLLLYPKDHETRVQFLADFCCVPRLERIKWVGGQLVRCLGEGFPARIRQSRQARQLKKDVERSEAAERLARLITTMPVHTDVVEVFDSDGATSFDVALPTDLVS